MARLDKLESGRNAYITRFDVSLLDDIRASYSDHIYPYLFDLDKAVDLRGERREKGFFGVDDQQYFYTNGFVRSLLWVSCNSLETYGRYRDFFDGLGIEQELEHLIDVKERMVMYCGFIMINDHAESLLWHVDYRKGANAFTLICPLFEIDEDHGGLIYKDHQDKNKVYKYTPGEAVIFGEGFKHSTEPFTQSKKKRVLLSLTFGTDRMKYWGQLKKTVGSQSDFLMLPCGHPRGSCSCSCIQDQLSEYPGDPAELEWAKQQVDFVRHKVLKNRPWSRTVRLETNDSSRYFFKILPETRRHEPRLTEKLASCFPGQIPEVASIDHEAGFLITKDHQGKRHRSRPVQHQYRMVTSYAEIQTKALSMPELMGLLPVYNIAETLNDVMHCLQPGRTQARETLKIGTSAKVFLGEGAAFAYWCAMQELEPIISDLIQRAMLLPATLTHGDLQSDNVAATANGNTVFYDWGEGASGPAGLSLSNPLFLKNLPAAHNALRMIRRNESNHAPGWLGHRLASMSCSKYSLDSVIGEEQRYYRILDAYIDKLVAGGYSDRQTLAQGLPGALLAGALRWLVSWSMEAGYDSSLAKTAGSWWQRTLDGVIKLSELQAESSGEPEKKKRRKKLFMQNPTVSLHEEQGTFVLQGQDGQIRLSVPEVNAWRCLEVPMSLDKLQSAMREFESEARPEVVNEAAIVFLTSLIDIDYVVIPPKARRRHK